MASVSTPSHRPSAFLIFEHRPSESPLIERVWRSRSERAGTFLSVAASNIEMVVTRHEGKAFLTVRGPETKATSAECPANGKWLGIRLSLGTYLPALLPAVLADRKDVTLPGISDRCFLLNGTHWELPSFENAEVFVRRLARAGIVWRDPAINAALDDAALEGSRREPRAKSLRSTQRHFRKVTGITRSAFRQIERARYAANLLRRGAGIADTVFQAGFFDQAHLTRSLKHLIGHTPARIIRGEAQLSFLYNTSPPDWFYPGAGSYAAANEK
jgi:AraC-like DNA-binding protein